MKVNHKLKKEVIVFLSVLSAIILFASSLYIKNKIELKNATVQCINIKNDTLQLLEEHNYLLKTKTSKEKFKDSVVFESKNSNVIEIDQKGNLYGKKIGNAQIVLYVKGADNKTVVNVEVATNPKILKDIDIMGEPKDDTFVGEKYHLKADYKPSTATERNVSWVSSDDRVATIDDNGYLNVKSEGNFTVTLKGARNLEKSITLEAKKKPEITRLEGIKKIDIEANEKQMLEFKDIDKNLYHLLSFKSSNNNIVTVDSKGNIKAIRPGKCIITTTVKRKKISFNTSINVVSNNGLITGGQLSKVANSSAKKLMIVAHPDDETLWGGGHLLDRDWFVVCLTHGFNPVRSREFKNAMSVSHSDNLILFYPDITLGKRDNWDSVKEGLKKDLEKLMKAKNWTQIATHSHTGETGHLHHKNTNKLVTEVAIKTENFSKLWYFGKFYGAGKVPQDLQLSLSEEKIQGKKMMLSKYAAEKEAIEKFWQQMIPFEYWQKAS